MNVGRDYARSVRAGDVFALSGDLGSGKTQFVKGFAAALGCKSEVTSPTFMLLHEYGGRLPVYHFDFYRLDQRETILGLGFEDYVYGDGVCVIEWAERCPDLIPRHAKWILFEIKNENTRVLKESKPQ